MIFMGDEVKDNPAYDVDELKKVNVPDLKKQRTIFCPRFGSLYYALSLYITLN